MAPALGLASRGHRKARASSGLWSLSCASRPLAGPQDCCRRHLRGCPGQRPRAQVLGAQAEAPHSCSCTPPQRQSYCRCRGSRRTRSGYTGPQRGRSTSGRPSPCRSRGRWAAGTAQGRLRGQGGGVSSSLRCCPAEPCQQGPTIPSASDLGARSFPAHGKSTPLPRRLTWPCPDLPGLQNQPIHLHPQN